MKQNITTVALMLGIVNLLFLNFYLFAGRIVPPVAAPMTLADMEAGLDRLEADFEERWAKKMNENTQSLSALVHEQMVNLGNSTYGSRPGTVSLPASLSRAGYRVGGQSSFGVSHIFAVKGGECPFGSNPANIPERQEAAAAGYIYCFYWRDSVVLSRRETDECPPDMKPVAKRGTPMRDDEFFCRLLRPE